MESKKVYCHKCIYYKCGIKDNNDVCFNTKSNEACCMSPNNIKSDNVDKFTNKFISSPEIINEFNNCRWYVSKNGDVTHTTFSLTNIPYGPLKYQLTNDGDMYYTMDIQSISNTTYQWTSNFKDILWDRELYFKLGKNTNFSINGSIKNESESSININFSLDINTSYGVTLNMTSDNILIPPSETYVFNNQKLTNIINFNDMYLMEKDILNFSFDVQPDYELDNNGVAIDPEKAKWKLSLNELILNID